MGVEIISTPIEDEFEQALEELDDSEVA